MTDIELIELAAKAAGYSLDGKASRYIVQGVSFNSFLRKNESGGNSVWNPLEDDGDAFRLAVKMEMCVSAPFCYSATAKCVDVRCRVTEQEVGGDSYAATRRAIVRAAAEIGKAVAHD